MTLKGWRVIKPQHNILDSDYPLILCPLLVKDPLEYFYDTW